MQEDFQGSLTPSRLTTEPTDLIGFALSVVGAMAVPLQPILQGDVSTGIVLSIFYVGAVFVLIRTFRIARQATPVTVRFMGVRPLPPAAAWPRDEHSERIAGRLTRDKAKLLVISGRSGSGKSVLLNIHVRQILENRGWAVVSASESL